LARHCPASVRRGAVTVGLGTAIAASLLASPALAKTIEMADHSAPANGATRSYTVQAGDTLSGIAKQFGVPDWRQLVAANPGIHDPNRIYPGQRLRIPVAGTTPAPTTAAPRQRAAAPARHPGGTVPGNSVWDRLAQCESGGNWHASGGAFSGGLQFLPSTWRSVGGTGLPSEASRETQIAMAERLLARSGWSQWPTCSRKLGLR
jgi:hypothetical protein